MKTINFDEEYAFLSNDYASPIIYDGMIYPTVEHAFQAAKTMLLEQRKLICEAKSSTDAKRAGEIITLRYDWQEVKKNVLEQCLYMKFITYKEIRDKLLAIDDETILEVCREDENSLLGQTLIKVKQVLTNIQRG